jgi:outer membrane lipoprotein-sorting protein
MKKLFFVLIIFSGISSRAQTAEEIIQKYSNTLGGLENFNKLKSLKMNGTVSTQGMDLPITIQIINGKALRSDVEANGQTITNVYKDGKGWKINPYQGITTATDVTGPELTELRSQSFIASQLMDYKARGYKVELGGTEDVEGAKAFKIKLTNTDNQKVSTYYIDANSYMLIKFVTSRQIMGQEMEVESYYKDVKEFEGLKFSTSVTQKIQGQVFQEIHFDKIELNAVIDDKIFEK